MPIRKRKRVLARLPKLTRTAAAHLRHPRQVTCLDCGFLALGDAEVNKRDRVLFAVRGVAGCPPVGALRCSRSLWVDYDLLYYRPNAAAIFEEIETDRRQCKGFHRYQEGYSPREHLDLLSKAHDKAHDNRRAVFIAFLVMILGLIATWLVKVLRLK